jgi:hypothetical protein
VCCEKGELWNETMYSVCKARVSRINCVQYQRAVFLRPLWLRIAARREEHKR